MIGEDHPSKAMLDAVLMPLVQQFSMMQNQMFDQFREVMVMMFQMFGSLQKNQMELIRQELRRVQDLSLELQALQAELKKQPLSPPGQPNLEWLAPCKQEVHREIKTAPENLPAEVKDSGMQTPVMPVSLGKEKVTAEQAGPEVHAWLNKRMAEIQEDGQSRLQKILNFLSGK